MRNIVIMTVAIAALLVLGGCAEAQLFRRAGSCSGAQASGCSGVAAVRASACSGTAATGCSGAKTIYMVVPVRPNPAAIPQPPPQAPPPMQQAPPCATEAVGEVFVSAEAGRGKHRPLKKLHDWLANRHQRKADRHASMGSGCQ